MRKLVLKMSISLDGFISGPDGEIDWIFRTTGADSTEWVADTIRQAGGHVMGSRTYRDMAAYWPYSDAPLAAPMNDIPKIIFSRGGITHRAAADETTGAPAGRQRVTPTTAVLESWAEPMVARGDLVEEVARLKEQSGKFILAHGGVRFAQSLVAAGLIDEYRLAIHPVALGRGQALFAALPGAAGLRLVSATAFSSGVVGAIYQPSAGSIP